MDVNGNVQRVRVEIFRILSLADPTILSEDFIQSHHDVWFVTKDVVATSKRVDALGWSRLKMSERLTKDAKQQQILQLNQVREDKMLELEKKQRLK